MAVQQLFLGLGAAVVLVLPVALLMLDRNNKVTLKSTEKIGQL